MIQENLVKVFEKSIVEHWDLPALSEYKGETLTYGQVGEQILKLQMLFEECGVQPNDKIALIGKNSINWAITYLAAVNYQTTIVPILADFNPKDIENIVNHSDSVLLFATEAMVDKIDTKNLSSIKAIVRLEDFNLKADLNGQSIHASCQKVNDKFKKKYPNGVAKDDLKFKEVPNTHLGVISYTSGTTGFSKGVMLPMQSLMANIHFAWHNMPLEAKDPLLSILPLAHSYGCAFEFLWPFTIGVHITFLGKIVSPQAMVEAFQEVKPRLLLMVPLIMEKLYKKRLAPTLEQPKMKFLLNVPLLNKLIYKKIYKKLKNVFGGNFREVVIGGAALNKDVEIFLRKIGFNFSVGYGMTECGPLISYANWDKTKLGSAGKLVDSLEMTIDSPDPYNQPGEILVRGENVMLGYYKNKEATEKAIDKEGWLHTGDLGIMNEDNFVFIRGRSKSLILGPSGENIYPEEIEAKLSNMPYVLEQVVVEDDKKKLVALVYPDLDLIKKDGLNADAIDEVMEQNKQQLNNLLPKYSQISKIILQKEEFLKTPKQSIKRFEYENLQN